MKQGPDGTKVCDNCDPLVHLALTYRRRAEIAERVIRWAVVSLAVALVFCCASARCEAFQLRADRKDPDKSKLNGMIHAWGSCFYVGKFHIMTCAHTLEGSENIFVKTKDGWVECFKKRVDKDADIALLETVAANEPIEFADIPALKASGAPKKFPPELMKIRDTPADIDISYVRAEVEQGDSGGCVTADGRLIGMVLAVTKMDDTTYAKIAGVMKIAEFLKGK